MLRNPIIRTVVLSCIALSLGCGGTETELRVADDTEINLLITDPNTPPEDLLLLIDFVSYRITCLGSSLTPYDDSVDIAGNFEVDAAANPPVWQLATDLPLSSCSIALWVFYEDEVICQGDEVLPLVDDDDPLAPNKVNILLECNLSVSGPSADLDIDGTFDFIHGNYCPKLNWLGAIPSGIDPLVFDIETSSFDVDSTCGQNCDPQTCDFMQNPPLCTPAPDPGFSSTLSAPAGNGSFDAPIAVGTPMPGGTPIDAQAEYTCDPLIPGLTEICALVSDGDNDCDQMRCITIICPDLCASIDCDDGNECTADSCDPATGVCSNQISPDGIACDNCNSTCQAGICDAGAPFVADIESDVMAFSGVLQNFTTTVVNPYSGASVFLNGVFNVNDSTYKGTTDPSWVLGTIFSDFLVITDPPNTQRICNVHGISADSGFDALVLADEFIVLGDMLIHGGTTPDLIWANAGNDTIHGNPGNDIIDGGPGDDTVEGDQGNDTVALWPGSGFDSIAGDDGTDSVEIDASQSQITIMPAVNVLYEFDVFYLGNPMAQVRTVELLDMNDLSIDLATCTGSPGDVCNLCGNDALNGGEECDDGNNVDGDGCGADCTAEY